MALREGIRLPCRVP